MSLIDDINRLFDEMLGPWSRVTTRPAAGAGRERETFVDLEMPIAGGLLDDVSLTLRGRELIVRTRHRSPAGGGEEGAPSPLERSFLLPEMAEVCAIEARVAGDVLRVRVCLRSGGR